MVYLQEHVYYVNDDLDPRSFLEGVFGVNSIEWLNATRNELALMHNSGYGSWVVAWQMQINGMQMGFQNQMKCLWWNWEVWGILVVEGYT